MTCQFAHLMHDIHTHVLFRYLVLILSFVHELVHLYVHRFREPRVLGPQAGESTLSVQISCCPHEAYLWEGKPTVGVEAVMGDLDQSRARGQVVTRGWRPAPPVPSDFRKAGSTTAGQESALLVWCLDFLN